jgi:hypothetical protein
LRHVPQDTLPIWLPDERQCREVFELVRDHWWAVKQYVETRSVRGVAIVDRLTAVEQGGWPPPILLRHGGQEYGVGETGRVFRHPAMNARMDQDPRLVRVVVAFRRVDTDPRNVIEFLFHLDRSPAGVELAGGDRPPGSAS